MTWRATRNTWGGQRATALADRQLDMARLCLRQWTGTCCGTLNLAPAHAPAAPGGI